MGAAAEGLSRSSFLVLLALADRPRHGLAILDRVFEASEGNVRLGPGTLYGTLQKLVAARLISDAPDAPERSQTDRRRRYYLLTPKGERQLAAEASRLRSLVRAAVAQHILGET